VEVCNKALCIKNCGKIIDELLSKNIFIQPVPSVNGKDNVNSYNYQVLFKTYLDSRFNETFSQEKTNEILKKAAEHYMEKDDLISAINCTIRAKDYKKAIPRIIENFDKLYNKAEFEFLWDWLSELENEIEIEDPNIVYYLGTIYKFYFGDLQRSLEYMEKAIAMFEKTDNEDGHIKCLFAKARILLNFGRTQEVLNELSGLLNKKTSNENRIHLLYLLAFSHFRNSEYDKTAKLLNESLALSKSSKSKVKEPEVFNLLGHIELIKGDYKQSAQNYETALDANPNLFSRFETLCNLVLLNSQGGNLNKAEEYLGKTEEMVNNFPTPIFKVPYLLSKQGYLFESRKYGENLNILNEINSIARMMNHNQYIYLSYRLLTDTYYYMNNPAKAKECFELASKFMEKDNELESIELSVIKALVWDMDSQESSTENVFLKAYEYYSQNEYTYSKAQTAYRLAKFYLKNGQNQKAVKYLEESLSLASKNGYVSFYIREYTYSRELFEFAVKNKLFTDFVNSIPKYLN
jgi:ATP/maltotriose-dependent transcriptional regulator MalT